MVVLVLVVYAAAIVIGLALGRLASWWMEQ